ncbi:MULTISPECIES: ATP-binding protein [unclassified Streptomyces]|uniref:ATP-binding protein n=1 Tax=unclassified Streptomyces TaxID=2593676 RepID=UPI0035E03B53
MEKPPGEEAELDVVDVWLDVAGQRVSVCGSLPAGLGKSVRYITTAALVNEFAEDKAGKLLTSVIARYSKGDLLCLIEFGSLNLDEMGAGLLIQICTEREEHKATAVSSHAPVGSRARPSPTPLCSAVAVRLTFKFTLLQTGTASHRPNATEAEHRAAW